MIAVVTFHRRNSRLTEPLMWPSLEYLYPPIMTGTLSHKVHQLASQHWALLRDINVFMWSSPMYVNKSPSWFGSHPMEIFRAHKLYSFPLKVTGSCAPGAHVTCCSCWQVSSAWTGLEPVSSNPPKPADLGPPCHCFGLQMHHTACWRKQHWWILDSLEPTDALSCSYVFQKYLSSYWPR